MFRRNRPVVFKSCRGMVTHLVAALFLTHLGLSCGPALGNDDAKTVRLTIDYGDGVQKVFPALDWSEKLTVLGALEAANKHPRGIKFTHQGSGETAFVTAIDDQKNEGRGARNWTYSVNDKRADQSCGACVLKAGDAVVWRFGL
jgi:hypothetical protein